MDEKTLKELETEQTADETALPEEEDKALVAADQTDDADDTEDDEDMDEAVEEAPAAPPFCDKVFGMYRLSLYGICFGYGGGLLVLGLFGLITGMEVTTSSIPGLIGAVIGYFIGHFATKRLLRKAEEQDQ